MHVPYETPIKLSYVKTNEEDGLSRGIMCFDQKAMRLEKDSLGALLQGWMRKVGMIGPMVHQESLPSGMCRFSIFYELAYWTKLHINHLLDPMHIFNNAGSLLWDHIIGKRDTLGARVDLKEMGKMESY